MAREGSHSCQHHLRPLLASRERERERERGRQRERQGERERERERERDAGRQTLYLSLSLSLTQPAAMKSRALVQGRGIRFYSLGLASSFS